MLENIKSGFRNSIVTLLELAQVRADMARVEINEQKNNLISVLILVLLAFIFLLVSFISLLFGLDNYLLPEQKVKVFFTISILTLLFVVICGIMIFFSLRKQRSFMQSTLDELKLDIAAFKNALIFKKNGDM
ncbi:phage holin family protein [Mannheimia sp. AT1]|uniref:Phage holin family protein n=1 Tax=Mannheimia cairinae TaxID=3025936 RepID=A0ABT5MSR4_9PAST|nr:phage holin family protein [Mannheimia cairinae]MDD0824998.1 phage holin family protein [Mannheimia cairinae]MDD0827236.1 phage holin family protein [Mannheimia cairinae]